MVGRLKPIARTSLTSQAARHVREYIFASGLRPGDRLPTEMELARRLGVSRPTVRQALKALEIAGLISSLPRDGTRVREFTLSQASEVLANHFHLSAIPMDEMAEARLAVEQGALSFIVRRITAEGIERLRKAASEYEAVLQRGGSAAEAISRDEDFHILLLELSGNRVLHSFATLLHSFFRHPRRVERAIPRVRDGLLNPTVIREHFELVEALEGRDLRKAQEVLDRHLSRTLDLDRPDER